MTPFRIVPMYRGRPSIRLTVIGPPRG